MSFLQQKSSQEPEVLTRKKLEWKCNAGVASQFREFLPDSDAGGEGWIPKIVRFFNKSRFSEILASPEQGTVDFQPATIQIR
jgi:hypothetical protein